MVARNFACPQTDEPCENPGCRRNACLSAVDQSRASSALGFRLLKERQRQDTVDRRRLKEIEKAAAMGVRLFPHIEHEWTILRSRLGQ